MNFFERLENYVWHRTKIPALGKADERGFEETATSLFQTLSGFVKRQEGLSDDSPRDEQWLAQARQRIDELVDTYDSRLKKHIREHCLGLSLHIKYSLPWPEPDFEPGIIDDFFAEMGKSVDGDARSDSERETAGREAAQTLWRERYEAVHALMSELGIGEDLITKNRYEISNKLLRNQLLMAAEIEACLRAKRNVSSDGASKEA